ncbi:MAG TPA: energy transducer TonB, partial [Geothrix sp.]
PCAVIASAPAPDHLRAAGITGLIYVAMVAFTAVLSNPAPHRILAPAHPPDRWRPVMIDPAPSTSRPAFHPVPTGRGKGASTTTSVTQPPAPLETPGVAATGLPTEDHHQDPVESGTGITGLPAPPGIPLGLPPGSAVHDFTSAGLTVLRQVAPAYPDFARRARIQGIVVLLMTVNKLGQPLRVQVLEGHPVFHEAAVLAARQWRFEPAQVDGHPVCASFRLTLKFSLR